MADEEQTFTNEPAKQVRRKTAPSGGNDARSGKAPADRSSSRRTRTVRNFPASSFEEPLEFATKLLEFGSGLPVRRLSFFDHIGKSPESGPSRQLVTNASKYGLIRGSITAEQLEITDDGKVAVGEGFSPREQARARAKLAIEDIEPFKALYLRFQGNKLPARAALTDAIKEFSVDPAAAEEAVDTFVVNLRLVGLLQTLSGADRIVSIDHMLDALPASSSSAPQPRSVNTQRQSLITGAQAEYEGTAFFVTPIGDPGSDQRKHSDLMMGSFIEPALEQFKLRLIRADRIEQPGIITRQVLEYLVKSRLVIADLSFHNPNVFYELAIRHMTRKPVVQIKRLQDSIPFDINQVRTIVIDNTDIYTLLPKVEAYRAEIASQVRSALDDPDSVDSPIATYFPDLRVSGA